MKFSLDLSEEPKFATKLEKQNLGKLGIFLKLPENFWQLFNSRKIVLPKFNDLIKDHKWMEDWLGIPLYGPCLQSSVDKKLIAEDSEEVWILAGTYKHDLNTSRKKEINRGIVKGKFLYDLAEPYLDNDMLLPWKHVVPGFIKSKQLGWIGWAEVSTNGADNTMWLITWNHHRFFHCQDDLQKKIKKFFKLTGIATRWAIGGTSIYEETQKFLREYDSSLV